MSTVLECFNIMPRKVTKVLALFFSVFPAQRLYKLCYVLSAAISLPLGACCEEADVPGVAAAAPGTSTDRSLSTPLPPSGQASQIH